MQLKKRILSIFLMLALLLSLGNGWHILAEQNMENVGDQEFVSSPTPEFPDESIVELEPETGEGAHDPGEGQQEDTGGVDLRHSI